MSTTENPNAKGKTPVVKGDYFQLFLKGFSTEEIKQKATELGADVIMPGRDAARAQLKDLSEADFNNY